MKEIELTQGFRAIVSDDDFDRVNGYSWSISGNKKYAATRIKRVHFYMHQIILGKAPKGFYIDHINGNGLDNRRENLRIVRPSESLANTRKRNFTSSKYKGVYWDKQAKMWRVAIQKEGKKKNLGYFKNEEDAGLAYNQAALLLFGEVAKLNAL